MDGHHGPKLALIMFALVVLHLVQAQDQEGFISLDCGLPPNESPYIEPTTKLNFSSDDDFIQTGKRGRTTSEWFHNYKQYNALRYFPDGTRNCYSLSVKQGINYLIRAGFAYGNYDGLNILPRFDLYIGSNLWISVYAEREENFEIIHMARSNSLQICLVKTGTTTPFISTLELRPLRNGAYSTQYGSLGIVAREFAKVELSIRYPDDVYDRQWSESYFGEQGEVNTTFTVNSSNPFSLPDIIARSAVTPKNASKPLGFRHSVRNPSDSFVIYLHFAEVQNLGANDTREFNIEWNGNITISAYSPKKLEMETIFNTSPYICHERGFCHKELVRTRKSTLPPLLNAFEIYNVMEFPNSETHPGDVSALKNIQSAYSLNITSWQGDPCHPEQWKWKGVECSYMTNKSIPPRIISLYLPSRGLSGIIVPDFQNLTQLQRLSDVWSYKGETQQEERKRCFNPIKYKSYKDITKKRRRRKSMGDTIGIDQTKKISSYQSKLDRRYS